MGVVGEVPKRHHAMILPLSLSCVHTHVHGVEELNGLGIEGAVCEGQGELEVDQGIALAVHLAVEDEVSWWVGG